MNGEQLIAIYKNSTGEIISFQTSAGRIISYRKALQEVEDGIITGVDIQENIDSHLFYEINDADDLPEYY